MKAGEERKATQRAN